MAERDTRLDLLLLIESPLLSEYVSTGEPPLFDEIVRLC